MKALLFSFFIWASTIISGSFFTAVFQHEFPFSDGLSLALMFSAYYGCASWVIFIPFFLYVTDEKLKISDQTKIVICSLSVPFLVFIGFLILSGFRNVMSMFEDQLLMTAFVCYIIAGITCMIWLTHRFIHPKTKTT